MKLTHRGPQWIYAVMCIIATIWFNPDAKAQQKYESSVPSHGVVLPGYSLDSFKETISSIPADRIEGVWKYVDDGVTLGIEQFADPDFADRIKYRIVLLEADDPVLMPGTVIGYLSVTAEPTQFYIWVYSVMNNEGIPANPVKCIAKLDVNTGTLIFRKEQPFKLRLRMNMSRLLPSLLKALSVSIEPNKRVLSQGFVKQFPNDFHKSEKSTDNQTIIYL